MAKQYDNTNTGALFKNNKQGNEKRPDYTGTVNVGGAEYWLSAWIKESKDGMKYMQLAVQPKEARGRQRNSAPDPDPHNDHDTDAMDIPF